MFNLFKKENKTEITDKEQIEKLTEQTKDYQQLREIQEKIYWDFLFSFSKKNNINRASGYCAESKVENWTVIHIFNELMGKLNEIQELDKQILEKLEQRK